MLPRPTQYEVVRDDGRLITLEVTCIICKRKVQFEMTKEQFDDYSTRRKLIQQIFPDYTPAEREMLIVGSCDRCLEDYFD